MRIKFKLHNWTQGMTAEEKIHMIDKAVIIPIQEIESHIFTIRGPQVILDTHLADFYEVKAIRLREQVKRNTSRFPEDFMFQLIENEVDHMVSQNAIPYDQHLGGFLPCSIFRY